MPTDIHLRKQVLEGLVIYSKFKRINRGYVILRTIKLTSRDQDYNNMITFFVFVSLPIHSGHQVGASYEPGSHRRKVTQDFSSTFFLRCVS